MSTADLKAKAAAELSKIEDSAVREYLVLKSKSYSLNVVLVVAAACFLLGLVV